MHAHIRRELTALLREHQPDEVADLPVPACPEWTVRDVVAHLVGVARDVLDGNLEGVSTEPWTRAHVDRVADRTLDEILDEWSELDPQVEEISGAFGDAEEQWLMDCLTHDADIRGALGAEPDRGSLALVVATGFLAANFQTQARRRGLPVPRLVAGEDEWTPPDGQVDGTAMAPLFELFRGLTGRRSLDQIRNWGWDVECDPFLPAFTWGPFTPRPRDLLE